MESRLAVRGDVRWKTAGLDHGYGIAGLDPDLGEIRACGMNRFPGLLAEVIETPGARSQFSTVSGVSVKKPAEASPSSTMRAESEKDPAGEMARLCLSRDEPLTRSPQET